ncbi:hypothetical protein EDC94DRAFT_697183 [Helicostylum pulchrum]|nr:hypothetical protein EDC94DRAFT_697183 [Helicostylum pulchrum]
MKKDEEDNDIEEVDVNEDTAMLYKLMTSFGDNTFVLFCKDGKLISSLPTAIKNKTAAFGSIFDIKSIKEYCNSRRLTFIYRISIQPGLVTCVINGSTTNTLPELEETAKELNKQLQVQKKNFNLEEADSQITDNAQDVSRNHDVSDNFTDSLLTNIKDLKFSGTDCGLQTMSVTVGVSLKMFNAHLNLYNKSNLEHPLPVKHQLDCPFLLLPKAHKLTSKNINYLCLKNQMSFKREQRKKRAQLGKDVSTIEMNLSKPAKPAGSREIDIKKQYNYYARERNILRSFYYSRVSSRERRTSELFTNRTKDLVAAKARRFVKGYSKKAIPIMDIGNAGTGVESPIKGYD